MCKLPFSFILLIALGLISSCEIEPEFADPLDTDKFIAYDRFNGLAGESVRDIYLDDQNLLWFACDGKGISVLDGEQFTTFNTSNSGLGDDRVTSITQDLDGNLWFGTVRMLYILVDLTDWYYFELIDGENVQVNSLYTDPGGTVWIGTEGEGLFYYGSSGATGQVKFGNPQEADVVNDVSLDSNGDLWIATDYAALKYTGDGWEPYPVNNEYPTVEALHLDDTGKLWSGSSGGYGLNYFYQNEFSSIPPFNGQVNIFVNDIASDKNGNLWFATVLDGVMKYDGIRMHSYRPYNGFPSEDNFCVEADHLGNIWIGTYDMGAYKYIPPVEF